MYAARVYFRAALLAARVLAEAKWPFVLRRNAGIIAARRACRLPATIAYRGDGRHRRQSV
jgi:hypothetical protein